MGPHVRRGFGEVAGSFLCFAAVLGGLVAADDRVRERMTLLFSQAADDRIVSWGDRVNELGAAVVQAARDQSISEAPLLIFAVVATVLVIFMLRT